MTEMTTKEFAAEIMAAQRAKRLRDNAKPWQPAMTPVTDLGYECLRRCVYHRVWPLKANPIGEELASIFNEGKLHEKDVRRELSELGYEVVESEVNFKDERLEISGTIDGKLEKPDANGRHGVRRIPGEIKGLAGGIPKDIEAWQTTESKLLKRYTAQIQTYMFLTEEPDGLELFKDKMTGLWNIIPVELDYEYVEILLQRAEKIRDAVRAIKAEKTESARLSLLPDRIPDRSECPGCPWRDSMCNPGDAPVDPLLIANDIILKAQLDRRRETGRNITEFNRIDKLVKERFRLTDGVRFVVGDHLVTKKRQKNSDVITFSTLGE